MKRFVILLSILVISTGINARQQDNNFKIGDLYYRIISEEERTCEVVAGNYQNKEFTIPSHVTIIGDEFTVIGINNRAFCAFGYLESITFPQTIRYIGDSTFYNCFQLKSIELPDNLESIGEGCFSLSHIESIKIPDKIRVIKRNTFSHCSLKKVIFPEELDSIESEAFCQCHGLTDISPFPEGTIYIGERAFRMCPVNEITLPESLKYIGESAFEDCRIQELYIPKNVVYLGYKFVAPNIFSCLSAINVNPENDFYSSIDGVLYDKQMTRLIVCPKMYEGNLTLPETITSIDDFCFYLCNNIESITFPKGLKSIGEYGFYYANVLSSLSLPENLESIGNRCFAYSSIPSVSIPASISYLGKEAFKGNGFTEFICDEGNPNYATIDGVLYNRDLSELIAYPNLKPTETFVVPGHVKSICDYAFYCNWEKPSPLTTISFENGLEGMGIDNFHYFKNLTTVELPASIKTIGRNFYDCDNIQDVTIYATTPPSDAGYLPDSNRKLHVLPECVNLYKNKTPWSGFGRIIGDAVAGMEGIPLDLDYKDSQFFTIDGKPTESMNPGKILVQKSSSGESKKIIVR